jgi:hypothetical protein
VAPRPDYKRCGIEMCINVYAESAPVQTKVDRCAGSVNASALLLSEWRSGCDQGEEALHRPVNK